MENMILITPLIPPRAIPNKFTFKFFLFSVFLTAYQRREKHAIEIIPVVNISRSENCLIIHHSWFSIENINYPLRG